MELKKLHISNSLELEVANVLTDNGIEFIHESQLPGQSLDFFLPQFNVYLEVKEYYSERSSKQLQRSDDIILIQGKKALYAFLAMVIL